MADGSVHTVFENGAWINEIEGHGPFPSTWATKEEAVAVGLPSPWAGRAST